MQNPIAFYYAPITNFLERIRLPLARIALFVIYFWFGVLKLFNLSPANPLVGELQQKTLPFLSFENFIILFALFEMLIGILFLIPKLSRLAIALFLIHMITTIMPMILLPSIAWQGFLVPTLEGQYIIKNLALIALAVSLGASLKSSPDNDSD